MFFVLHDYYDINIIFFVFVGLERKVFAIPQLSPMQYCYVIVLMRLVRELPGLSQAVILIVVTLVSHY